MFVSFLSIATNYGLNQYFTFHLGWGHRGLAFSTGLVALTNFGLLYLLMHRHTGRLETRQMISTLAKLALSGALLAATCWSAEHWLFASWSAWGFLTRLSLLFGVIALAGGLFFASAMLLRIEELDDVTAMIRRKLSRRRAAQ